MRHGKKINHLGRTSSHRAALLSNLAISLIMSKRIETTVAKAKALRRYVEPLLTRAKEDNYNNRKVIFQYLNNKETMKELFNVVSEKLADRPGGYTRIIKLGARLGDSAELCLIELVDFNETLLAAAEEKATATKTRRSRRGGGRSGAAETAGETIPAAVVVADETPVIEAGTADVVEETTEVVEKVGEEAAVEMPVVDETPVADAPATDEPTASTDEEPKQA
jgi:large subunit ribosomal protein L17